MPSTLVSMPHSVQTLPITLACQRCRKDDWGTQMSSEENSDIKKIKISCVFSNSVHVKCVFSVEKIYIINESKEPRKSILGIKGHFLLTFLVFRFFNFQ